MKTNIWNLIMLIILSFSFENGTQARYPLAKENRIENHEYSTNRLHCIQSEKPGNYYRYPGFFDLYYGLYPEYPLCNTQKIPDNHVCGIWNYAFHFHRRLKSRELSDIKHYLLNLNPKRYETAAPPLPPHVLSTFKLLAAKNVKLNMHVFHNMGLGISLHMKCIHQ